MTADPSEPRTKAGRVLLADVREVIIHGVRDRFPGNFDLAWHVRDRLRDVEDEAAALVTPAQPAPEPSDVCPHCGALYADEAEMRCSSCGQSAVTPAQPALDYERMVEAGFLDAYLNINGVLNEAEAERLLREDMAEYARLQGQPET